MRYSMSAAAALSALTLVRADNPDPGAALTKPPLEGDLNYVIDGLMANLPETQYTLNAWTNGYIPQECKDLATSGDIGALNLALTDFTIYDVTYSDCGAAWTFCHHNNAQVDIDTMASTWGRLPIQMREWVKHVITVPDDGAWAFETDGVTVFLGDVPNLLSVIIHETGHSLDLNGAYNDKPFSSSDNFWNAYNADTNVPDNYAGSNAIEDVAQNTVVATFDVNVPGGFPTIEPNYEAIANQYNALAKEAADAGNGNSIIKPGEGSTCNQRMPASTPVPINDSTTFRIKRALGLLGPKPDVSFPEHIKLIDNSFRKNKHSGCQLGRQ